MRNIKVSCPFCFPFYLYKYWGSVPYLAQGHLQLIQVWHNKMSKEVFDEVRSWVLLDNNFILKSAAKRSK